LNVPPKVIWPVEACKTIQLNPSGNVPAEGNVKVAAVVPVKRNIIPLSAVAIVLPADSVLTFETKPLNLEVAALPPVKFPEIVVFPELSIVNLDKLLVAKTKEPFAF
jgi:hypothetical protein